MLSAGFSSNYKSEIIDMGLSMPRGVCPGTKSGEIYVADTGNNCIKKLSDGVITIIASGLSSPQGVCVDSFGYIYVADTGNNLIRKLSLFSAPTSHTFSIPPGQSETLSGTYSTAYILGGGIAVLPASNSVESVEVSNGVLQVSSSASVTFNAPPGSAALVEVTSSY